MTATFKSRVLIREEKGFAGISMKRLIFCAMGAGLIYMLLRLTPLQALSIPVLIVVFLLLIVFSGTRYGVARYAWLLHSWRGRLLLDAHNDPHSSAASLCHLLDIAPGAATIHAADLFQLAVEQEQDLSGMQILHDDALTGYEILSADDIQLEEA